MKVNFDGMRKQATASMNSLYDIIHTILDEDTHQKLDDDLKEELKKRFNESAFYVDNFNCLSDKEDENFNELNIDINTFSKS